MSAALLQGIEAALELFDEGRLDYEVLSTYAWTVRLHGYRALADALDAVASGPASSTLGPRRELARLERARCEQRLAEAVLDAEVAP